MTTEKEKTLKDNIIIFNNLPSAIQKEMNENLKFRENIFEKTGYIKYKELKQAILELETKALLRLNDKKGKQIKLLIKKIFGDFEE